MVDPRMAQAHRARVAAAFARRATGLSFLYVILILAIIMVFVAFAVDVGRMRIARAQLQTAADASARAGADGLPHMNLKDGAKIVLNRAEAMAEQNQSLGQTIDCDRIDDIDLGQWNKATRTFTELPDDRVLESNAVRTTTRRLVSRNNAVPLIFAPITAAIDPKVKPTHNEIQTPAIAYVSGGPTNNFAVVGLQGIDINGNGVTISSYKPPAVTQGPYGSIASNGDIIVGNGNVIGDVRPGVNGEIDSGPNAKMTGWRAPLDKPLANGDYAIVPQHPGGATQVTMPQGSNKTPSGNGYFWTDADSVNFTGGTLQAPKEFWVDGNFSAKKVDITGYIVLYVEGDVDLMGASFTLLGNDDPRQFKLIVCGTNRKVSIGGTPDQKMLLIAPGADVKVNGTTTFYGKIIGRTVTMTGTIDIHYPETLMTDTTPFRISLVK